MKIERVGENKIRIFVSYDDLEERDIDLDAFNYNSPETQELFWDLMEQAEIELGFDTQESQLCIEAVSDTEHGFVITITRIEEDSEFESIQKFIKNRYRKKDLSCKKRSQKICSTLVIYAVEGFDALCRLCSLIHPLYTGRSRAYVLDSTYYLVLCGIEGNVSNRKRFESILSEYADKMQNVDFLEGYLNEYGKRLVSDDAVAFFASMEG
ncbi:adaptor protein MecA [Thermoclostridium caenicola]|uniref:Adapter protein MecA 1/2 n=1 Tax=Thermoclostridium caenicola TaxID=659425 RepID=A0A1M6JMK5_9FIRM|nr:adaptor protein MecA [Thermoclostridium caenicola]SHJ47902.1 adapter protein MecA 1/2 [Thermoclostridium caenicola]